MVKQEERNKRVTDKHIVKYSWVIKMMFPVRCYTCGKPIGHLWEEFLNRVNAAEDKKKVLDDLGIERYCCRRLFLSHVDLIDIVNEFRRV